jgi:TonB family protein
MATQTPAAKSVSRSAPKILRLGIIQNGRIIEERLLRTRGPVTIGEDRKNTFVVMANGVAKSYLVFDLRQEQFVLRFDRNMSGRISVGSGAFDLAALRESGKARQEGDSWAIALDERSRGKVTMGEVTILFQFVAPPPLRMAPSLPSHIRGGPVQFVLSMTGLQGPFLFWLGFSAFFQLVGTWYLVERVPPPPRPSLEESLEQIVAILRDPVTPPEELPEPDPSELADNGEEVPVDEELPPEPEPEERPQPREPEQQAQPQSGDAVRERVQEQVAAGTAIGSLLTGAGPGVGIAAGGPINVERAMADIAGQVGQGQGGIVSATGLGTNDGVGTGAERVGVVEQNGSSLAQEAASATGQEAGTGREVEVRARVRGNDAQMAGSGRLDSDALNTYLGRQQRRLQQCYERELARNPDASGRVQIQFTVDASGRVSDARIPNSELPESVGNCILTEVRRWNPGAPDGGSVTVRRTYLFETGS